MLALFMFAAEGDPAWALFVCVLMTVALIIFTFRAPRELAHGSEKTRLSYLRERKDQVYENLRDLNFEHKAGKLPEPDYESLRASLENEAAAILAEIEQLESAGGNAIYTSANQNPKGARP